MLSNTSLCVYMCEYIHVRVCVGPTHQPNLQIMYMWLLYIYDLCAMREISVLKEKKNIVLEPRTAMVTVP